MSQLLNSVVRGFGTTLGRKAANRVTSNSKVSSDRNYLTFWEGIKTILWFFPTWLLSMILVMIYDGITGKFQPNSGYDPNFNVVTFWAFIFTLIIGYGYYNKKK